jgi:HD-like signal output (HDOD) protein/CheY-like chemotaxis protein
MMRVLFVDDERFVLEATKRAMHCMRNEWEMEFLPSGAEALASLAKAPADVIVSDVRMPGMDGWQLLAEVKKLYPQTVRLVLSGYAEPGAIMRLVTSAHQYLAKPGNSESLKAAVAQTQLMKSLLSNESLVRLVGEVGVLPTFPNAVIEISNCLRKPNATIGEAAQIISRDVAMTANLMKVMNSAFFGSRRQVTSVERAVAYLGFDTLTALVLGHSLFCAHKSSAMEVLWRHSFETARAAREIALAEQLSPIRVEEAFLAGMLHDVGRVVFATRTGPQASTPAANVDTHHAEVGAYLLGLWGFPSHIVAASALHHKPSARADRSLDLTVLVHVADRLAHREPGSTPALAESGIEPGVLDELKIVDHWPKWLEAVSRDEEAHAA